MSLDWVLTPARVSGAAALLAAYAALCLRTGWMARQRRLAFTHDSEELAGHVQGPPVLVVFASQTGQAEGLARAAARMLGGSGFRVTLLPVDRLDGAVLRSHPHSLWMLSTTGEGDAPDHALHFVQKLLAGAQDLSGHRCQVLALGDREYRQFCSFGIQVHEWLLAQGAEGDLICVDNMERAALQAWQGRVNELRQAWLGQDAEALPAQDEWLLPPASEPFILKRRTLLNPGSQGGPLYLLEWEPVSGRLPAWQSGDLASLAVPADPDRPRDYSIASIVEDGSLQMLVRLSLRDDGIPGLASGWLCEGMAVGDSLALAIRQHSSFRLGENRERPLILIGNGSGLAGLLGHLKARVRAGRGDQWLVFGERNSRHDAFCGEQLAQWLREGWLQRLDQAWSRDGDGARYVQDVLLQQQDQLKAWVQRGAAIYVCGSQQGMGQGVDRALRLVLGDTGVQALVHEGRYRRDVY
ncbi:sulfite reductase subunit alpha [Comamonas terrae]|uniref:NADPH--hemoprotein reductase n=1 Tax=Comamonas terrae TaxID=673548 RepID=A0ABW5US66_9BURK|nr:sulfite reductase subunit alpha [Comamonas terrae]